MKNTSLLLGLIAGSASLISSAQAQNIVTNGGFESGTVDSTPTGWTSGFTGNAADPWVRAGTFFDLTQVEGANQLQFRSDQTSPTGGAFISQALTTVADTEYDLSFALGVIGSSDDLSVFVTVTSDGGSLGDLFSETIVFSGTGSYTTYDRTFTATDTSSTLRFLETSTNTSSRDPLLDDVSVSVVPEPGTYALLAGLTGLAFVMVRRRRA